MDFEERVDGTGEAAWQSMRDHHIPPTPRNFRIWYTYRGNGNPALCARIDQLLAAGDPFTPGTLDELFQDHLAAKDNTAEIQDQTRELASLAAGLSGQVRADRGMIETFGGTLDEWRPFLTESAKPADVSRAFSVLRTATAATGERLHALEQLFGASLTRIGELEKALSRAEREATRDALTGLANRRMFDLSLSRAASEALTEGTPLSLLMLDIDHFKKFNDTHGHATGDSVLRLLAKVLIDHIKGRDTAARYGGEEFGIILVGADLPAAMTIGDQIRDLLERRPLINRATGLKLGVVTCSIGVAGYRPGEALGDFVNRADTALYTAKRTGRNRVCSEAPDQEGMV